MVGGGRGGVNSRWYHTSPPIAARAAASLAPNPTAGNPSVRLRVRRRRPTPALSTGLRRGHRGDRCRLCVRSLGGLPRIEERVLVPQRLSSAETHREARRPDALWDVRAMVGGSGEGTAVTRTPPRECPALPPWALPPESGWSPKQRVVPKAAGLGLGWGGLGWEALPLQRGPRGGGDATPEQNSRSKSQNSPPQRRPAAEWPPAPPGSALSVCRCGRPTSITPPPLLPVRQPPPHRAGGPVTACSLRRPSSRAG